MKKSELKLLIKEILQEQRKNSGGDCYDKHGRIISGMWDKEEEKEYKLCHGVAILKTDGKPFGHCWIEVGHNTVIDKSNGNDFHGPKMLYYTVGGIPAKGWEKIYKYSPSQVREKILETSHWGPWDYDPPR